jgi:hypothetical protein
MYQTTMTEDETSKKRVMHDNVHSFQNQRTITAATKAEAFDVEALNTKTESRRKGFEWAMSIDDLSRFEWLSNAKQARIYCRGRNLQRVDDWSRILKKLNDFGIPIEGREDFAQAAVDAYEEAEK